MSPSSVRRPAIALVIAAGASSRMGSPKALLPVDGVPLLRLHEQALSQACVELRVVLGCRAAELGAVLDEGTTRLLNPGWATTGPRESILSGLEGLAEDALVVVTPVDAPPVDPDLLSRLLETEPPAAVGHQGQPGHPVLVRAGRARRILSAGGTLREVVGTAPRVIEAGSADVLLNLNTPEQWAAWRG